MRVSIFPIVAGTFLILGAAVFAQQVGGAGSQGNPTPPAGDGQARLSIVQMGDQARQALALGLKAQLQHDLDASDDEMEVIWAKRQAVSEARFVLSRDTIQELISVGYIPLARLRSYSFPQDYNPDLSDFGKALANLDKAEKDPAASPDQLADVLKSVRQFQRKYQADVQDAQDNLRKILTARREAVCIVWGILDIPASDIAPAHPSTTMPAITDGETAQRQAELQEHQKERQILLTRIKDEMGISDADFSVLQPLIEKCLETSEVAEYSKGGSFASGHTFIPATPHHAQYALRFSESLPTQDLDRMLMNPDTPAAALKAQEQLIRLLGQQADDDYAAACKELRALVTRRQEVVLFLNNVLD